MEVLASARAEVGKVIIGQSGVVDQALIAIFTGHHAIIEGVPAGLPLLASDIDADLARRMLGHGRGARMQVESDRVQILSGVRSGETIGSPITLVVENWRDVTAVEPAAEQQARGLTRPRPGHADLAGVLKYDRRDARDVLERASERETVARVAAGAVCRRLLAEFSVEIGSHVVSLGGIDAKPAVLLPEPLNAAADRSPVRCLDRAAETAMVARIDAAKAAGDTLGGVAEVVARRLVVGLGSHVSWDRKLDGRLAAAWMSIPAVKGVEIGLGFSASRLPGSQTHDELRRAPEGAARRAGGFVRANNRAGGLEGAGDAREPSGGEQAHPEQTPRIRSEHIERGGRIRGRWADKAVGPTEDVIQDHQQNQIAERENPGVAQVGETGAEQSVVVKKLL